MALRFRGEKQSTDGSSALWLFLSALWSLKTPTETFFSPNETDHFLAYAECGHFFLLATFGFYAFGIL